MASFSPFWRKLAVAGGLFSGGFLDDCPFYKTLLCSELCLVSIMGSFSLVCAMYSHVMHVFSKLRPGCSLPISG